MNDFPIRAPEQLIPMFSAFRKRAGLTQSELARRIGVGQQTVSQLERNPEKATLERLLRAFAALDVELVLRRKQSVPAGALSAPTNNEDW